MRIAVNFTGFDETPDSLVFPTKEGTCLLQIQPVVANLCRMGRIHADSLPDFPSQLGSTIGTPFLARREISLRRGGKLPGVQNFLNLRDVFLDAPDTALAGKISGMVRIECMQLCRHPICMGDR